jgi:hypothetical protein
MARFHGVNFPAVQRILILARKHLFLHERSK